MPGSLNFKKSDLGGTLIALPQGISL